MNWSEAFTQGGQTAMHKLRMIKQIITVTLLISMISGTLFIGVKTYFSMSSYQFYLVGSYYLATFKLATNSSEQSPILQQFKISNGKSLFVLSEDVVRSKYIRKEVAQFEQALLKSAFQAVWAVLISFILVSLFWVKRGHSKRKKRHVKGIQFAPSSEVIKRLHKTKTASDLRLGSVPLVKKTETEHILITGTTGSGKTNCFHELLPQIRRRGERGVIVDTTGDFVERYYRKGQDKILNPLDQRGEPWHIWGECDKPYHYDDLAEAMIPQLDHDSFWTNAARTVFSVAAQKLAEKNQLSTQKLLEYLISLPIGKIQSFFKGTEAATLVDKDAEKMAISIRATLSVTLKCLKYLDEVQKPFSLRDWVREDEKDEWIFLSSLPEQRATLRPLLTAWMASAAKALMTMPINPQRRLWLIIDELPSLYKLPSLPMTLAEIRKYGGCVVAGAQDLFQLDKIYGQDITKSITSLCNTKVMFSMPDRHVAERMATALGQQEVAESMEGVSFGSHQVRDGVSLSEQRKIQSTIMPEDLMKLDKLEAYLKLPGDLPLTKIKFDYHAAEFKVPSFIEKEIKKRPDRKKLIIRQKNLKIS
ncbi:MAG: type IV conjugative transfer system coupling protein TraD [Alphaproteobacteria bacterium]|nr:type IV conjugative transfer system coupling protein TraD [Alphaproteobacteria bacterium]